MRRVVPLLIVLCLGFAPAPMFRERPGALKGDLEKMQGRWVVERHILNGKEMPPRTTKSTVEIDGDRIRFYLNGELRTEWAITLDVAKQPKQLDQKKLSRKLAGAPDLLSCIYRLDGDSLQLAYISGGQGRPLDFEGKGRGQANCMSSVLKRIKP